MKTVNIVLRPTSLTLLGEDTIGVDAGALYCLNKDIPMIKVLGDFDSIERKDLERIKENYPKLEIYSNEKNETDFELALRYVTDYDLIYVYGGLGNRRDHEYINVLFICEDSRIVLLDEDNRIQSFTPGKYIFEKNDYKYISIIPLKKGEITLEGFKYPLNHVPIDVTSRFLTSNEIDDEGVLTLTEGLILVIQSK